MATLSFSDREFKQISDLMYEAVGLSYNDSKKSLIQSRLAPRIQKLRLNGFADYIALLTDEAQAAEFQMAVDLLTTNETYFFREPGHFTFLRDTILKQRMSTGLFRVWSAASSTGEEVYTLAMVLAESLPKNQWEVVGSDISTQVLGKAAKGHYPLARNEGIPTALMSKYCLKGVRSQAGTFLISPELRQKTRFQQVNLTLPIAADLGEFDVIFLRNVMIYFDMDTKRKVVANLLPRLKRGGYLLVGHAETLNGISTALEIIQPTVYRKP